MLLSTGLLVLPQHAVFASQTGSESFVSRHATLRQSDTQGSRTVKGRVLDEKGEPLIGVTVYYVETKQGGVTDVDGNYKVTIGEGSATIRFTYVGMKDVTSMCQQARPHRNVT